MDTSNLKQYIEKVPRADDGFCVSFDVTDVANWQTFFAKHGFVVVKVLTKEECAATRDEFFATVNAQPRPDGEPRTRPVSLNDPLSWESENWPNGRGKYLVQHPAITPCALRNRTHPNVYALYSRLFNTPRVFANVDVWGVMRGTSELPCEPSERPEWRQHLDPHWDVNPRRYQEARKAGKPPLFQGVLALVDCDDLTGGFTIAPGSAVHLDKWVAAVPPQKSERENHYDTSPSDPWRPLTQPVPIREGEMVVWDSGSLHANYSNHGPNMRIVQYLRCSTDDFPDDPQWGAFLPQHADKKFPGINLVEAAKAADLQGTALQMLGLAPYPNDPKKKK